MNHRLKLLALATVALVFATGQALAQTRVLYVPADSVSAGGMSLSAITNVCTAGNNLCVTEATLPSQVAPLISSQGRSWTTYFIGQSKCFGTYFNLPTNCFDIRSDGHVYGPYGSFTVSGIATQQNVPQSAARDLGFPYELQPLQISAVSATSGGGGSVVTNSASYLMPSGGDSFGSPPTDWTFVPSTSTGSTYTCSGMYC